MSHTPLRFLGKLAEVHLQYVSPKNALKLSRPVRIVVFLFSSLPHQKIRFKDDRCTHYTHTHTHTHALIEVDILFVGVHPGPFRSRRFGSF